VIDCVLISADEEFRRLVLELVRHQDSHAHLALDINKPAHEVPREALGRVLGTHARVVFIDLADSTTGVRVVRALNQEAPEIAVIATGPELTADALLQIMRSGASEYLPRPLSRDDAVEAFARTRRRITPVARDGTPVKEGRLTTVFSAKGGTGVTMLATNLAISLRQITDESVLLLDLAPSLGTAALALGLAPRYSYLDVVQNFHRIDEELLRSFLELHECGLAVLASPPAAEDPSGITTDQALGLIRLCRRHFAHVVVDGGAGVMDAVGAALMESDHKIAVTTPELPTLRNLKRAIEVLYTPSTNGHEPLRVVLNRFDEDSGVSARDVETGLGFDVSVIIARDDTGITQSINLGEPVVLAGRSRVAKELYRLGADIAGPDYVVHAGSGLIGSLLKPFRGSKSTEKETD
jgi:pilus assembly protein CpaE